MFLRCIVLLVAISLASSPDPRCQLDIHAGDCRAIIPSYGFEKSSAMCIPFTYGGCGGNDNRFSNQEECERACVKVPDFVDE